MDRVAIRPDGSVQIAEDRAQGNVIGVLKRAFEKGLGNFKADKVVVSIRGIPFLGYFQYVESKLRLQVRNWVIFIGHDAAIFLPEIGVKQGNGAIYGAMPIVIRGIMRQCPQREGVLVEVLRISKQSSYELPAAHVVCQITEETAAMRVIAKVLDKRAPIGVSMRRPQLFGGGVREALQKQRPDLLPGRINDGFVREDRVSVAR